METFRAALLAWWEAVWPDLLAYQRRFVENGRRDDDTWGYEFGTKAFDIYEWHIVLAAIREDAYLAKRVDGGVRTMLGAASGGYARELGQHFFNAAYARIRNGRLFVGSPAPFFDETYAPIEAFLSALALPYRATTMIVGLAIPSRLDLDEKHRLLLFGRPASEDARWHGMEWPREMTAIAALETDFELALLEESQDGNLNPFLDKLAEKPRRLLAALAIVQPQHALIGPTMIEPLGFTPSRVYRRDAMQLPAASAHRTTIATEDVVLLRSAWVGVPKLPAGPRIAAERLARAYQNADRSDALVEAVTALEAVVGTDAEGELAHRISLTAARLIGEHGSLGERDIYESMIRAFERRGSILRGRERSVNPGGDELLIGLADRIVRRLLQLWIADDTRLALDKTDLLLGKRVAPPK